MKTKRAKRVLNDIQTRSDKAREAREASPALMQVYTMFLPAYQDKGLSKFVTDKYGNRVLRKQGKRA